MFTTLTKEGEAARRKRTNEITAELRKLWGAEPSIDWYEIAKYDSDNINRARDYLLAACKETDLRLIREEIRETIDILDDEWEADDEFASDFEHA